MAEKQLDNERQIIETYMQEHGLEKTLNDVVNEVVKTRPLDPYVRLGQSLLRSSETANAITGVDAREILDGQGRPALEVEVSTQQGGFTASTTIGPYDEDEDRYGGRGLKKAADSVKAVLGEKLLNVDVTSQESIDATLSGEDAAPANAVLACSMACCPGWAIVCNITSTCLGRPSPGLRNSRRLPCAEHGSVKVSADLRRMVPRERPAKWPKPTYF